MYTRDHRDFRDVKLRKSVVRMDPDCAICRSPATLRCDCEAKGLDQAVRQAEQRMMQSVYNDIRFVPHPSSRSPPLHRSQVCLQSLPCQDVGPLPCPGLHPPVLPLPDGAAQGRPLGTSGPHHRSLVPLLPPTTSPERDHGGTSHAETRHRRRLAGLGSALPGGARVLLQPGRLVAARGLGSSRQGPSSERPVGPAQGRPEGRWPLPHRGQRKRGPSRAAAGEENAAASGADVREENTRPTQAVQGRLCATPAAAAGISTRTAIPVPPRPPWPPWPSGRWRRVCLSRFILDLLLNVLFNMLTSPILSHTSTFSVSVFFHHGARRRAGHPTCCP